MKNIKNLFQLFYPNLCINCENQLLINEEVICIVCRNNMPLLKIYDFENNIVTNAFFGKTKLNRGYSFLNYQKKGMTKNLISNLKYKNREDIGEFLGNWFGSILKEKQVFDTVDFIVPVPLHKNKLKKRGYNQITKFSKSLSSILSIKYKPNVLVRTSYNKTQTKKNRIDRFVNIENHFNLTDEKIFENKHILLVDDVITSGATIRACCNELQKTKNINISIVSIAFTGQN